MKHEVGLDTKKTTKDLLLYFFSSYRWQSLVVIVAFLLAGLAETLGVGALLPLITIVVDDQSSGDDSLTMMVMKLYDFLGLPLDLPSLLSVIAAAITTKAVISFYTMRYVGYVSAEISRNLRMRLMSALMKAQWNYYSGLPLGKVANMVSSEAMRAGSCYMLAGRTVASFIQAIVYIALAFVVSWQVSLVAIVVGCVVAFIVKKLVRMARAAGADVTRSMNKMLVSVNESLSGIKPLKAMGRENQYIAELDMEAEDVMEAHKRQLRASLLLRGIQEPVAVIILSVGLYYILTYTEILPASVFVLALLFYRLITQINLMQSYYQHMVQNESAVWGMVQYCSEAEGVEEKFISGLSPTLEDKISIEDITVSYDDNKTILSGFSGAIEANKLTVVFGPSGIGKTTLIDVILGLLPLDSGDILIDDVPISKIDTQGWRQMVGYVPQETFLFHDTIMQNVTLGDKSFSRHDVEKSLKEAALWEFVNSLPESMDSVVGEAGGKLSGGQRQRIALARSLVRNPRLLVLDEATTGLDQESRDAVLQTIKRISQEITVVVISHDPGILTLADHVIDLAGVGENKIIGRK